MRKLKLFKFVRVRTEKVKSLKYEKIHKQAFEILIRDKKWQIQFLKRFVLFPEEVSFFFWVKPECSQKIVLQVGRTQNKKN